MLHDASPATIAADGVAATTLTATVAAAGQPLAGEHLSFSSTDPNQTIGPVTDKGDGTYTATLTASHTPRQATITAADASVTPAASATTSPR